MPVAADEVFVEIPVRARQNPLLLSHHLEKRVRIVADDIHFFRQRKRDIEFRFAEFFYLRATHLPDRGRGGVRLP